MTKKFFSGIWFPIFLALLLGGCSSARNRGEESDLYSILKFKSDTIEDFFHEQYRSGNIYLNYGTALIVDVIYKDLNYRNLYHQEFTRTYFLDESSGEKRWEDNVESYKNAYEFLLFIYSGSNAKADLGKASSEWQVFFQDEEGDVLRPFYLKRMKKKVNEVIFLDKYFYPLDRWTEVFLVKFPKLNKAESKGEEQVKLIISGIRGQTSMFWSEKEIFYQNPEVVELKEL